MTLQNHQGGIKLPFCTCKCGSSEKKINLPKDTQLNSGGAMVGTLPGFSGSQ